MKQVISYILGLLEEIQDVEEKKELVRRVAEWDDIHRGGKALIKTALSTNTTDPLVLQFQ